MKKLAVLLILLSACKSKKVLHTTHEMVKENNIPRRQYNVADVSYLKYQSFYDSKKEKYGVADSSGNVIINAKYEYINSTPQNTFRCVKNGKFGVIDINENVIIPFGEFQSIDEPSEGLTPARKFGSWGFIDAQGSIVIPFLYTQVVRFKEGRSFVQKELEGNYAIIDNTGKFISDFVFTCNNSCFFRENKCLVYYKSEFMDIIDRNGKPMFDFSYRQLLFSANDYNNFWVKKDKLWGKINGKNEVISPFEYENVTFMNGKIVGLKNGVWIELK